jgi:hypothetical protein
MSVRRAERTAEIKRVVTAALPDDAAATASDSATRSRDTSLLSTRLAKSPKAPTEDTGSAFKVFVQSEKQGLSGPK